MKNLWTKTENVLLARGLYLPPCPKHFNNRNFNEVNLFKTVDEGITTFSLFLPCLSVSISMFPLFPHSLCLSQGGWRGGFHIHSLPSLISHVCGFSRSPSQSGCSSRVQGLPLSSVRPPQRQSNKGLRQRKGERETIKGKRRRAAVVVVVVVVVVSRVGDVMGVGRGGGTVQDRNSKLVRVRERQRQWGADWDSKKGKQH